MGRFDWSASDGLFKKIVGAADEGEWVTRCNEALASLKDNCALEHREEILEGQPSQSGSEAKVLGLQQSEKESHRLSSNLHLLPKKAVGALEKPVRQKSKCSKEEPKNVKLVCNMHNQYYS